MNKLINYLLLLVVIAMSSAFTFAVVQAYNAPPQEILMLFKSENNKLTPLDATLNNFKSAEVTYQLVPKENNLYVLSVKID